MALGIASYPTIKNEHYLLIQDFRKQNDELYYTVAEPHFAFVFPVSEIPRDKFIEEAITKAKGSKPIDFEIRCATVNKDIFLDYYHLLLVPDKGYSDVVKLHDKLYSGLLFPHLRLDIDFIPHVGIANARDKYNVKKWAGQWNAKDFCINGTIEKLMVVDYTNNILTDILEINLK